MALGINHTGGGNTFIGSGNAQPNPSSDNSEAAGKFKEAISNRAGGHNTPLLPATINFENISGFSGTSPNADVFNIKPRGQFSGPPQVSQPEPQEAIKDNAKGTLQAKDQNTPATNEADGDQTDTTQQVTDDTSASTEKTITGSFTNSANDNDIMRFLGNPDNHRINGGRWV